jgi:hypothetical protein
MSAFSEVTADAQCPKCGKVGTFTVQFTYGNTWQFKYHIGDCLRWGGNDIGRKDAKRVVVEGIGGPCQHYGTEFIEFSLLVEKNRLLALRAVGVERPSSSPEGFIILDD